MQHKLLSMSFILLPLAALAAPSMMPLHVYIGTYTGPKSQGIYVSQFDPLNGRLSAPQLAAELKNTSFLAVAPTGKYLYAVEEVGESADKSTGYVAALRISDGSGKLELLNKRSSGGSGPCHLAFDAARKCVLTANYGSGSISILPVNSDGSLGEPSATIQHQGSSVNPERQTGPHAHFICTDPASRFVLACDLGLDKVLVYRLDPSTLFLTPNDPPAISMKPGSGPRHLVFHPNGRFVYVINEMRSTLTVCSYDPWKGALNTLQSVSTLPPSFKGHNTCAEVQVHPSGKFLYASNRGHDSLALFSIDPDSALLTSLGHQFVEGKTPRHFTLDPTGAWLLAENQDSNNIVVFRVDTGTGKLAATGNAIEVGSPACAVFAPTSF
jgi:6-phosphogluconolactonase